MSSCLKLRQIWKRSGILERFLSRRYLILELGWFSWLLIILSYRFDLSCLTLYILGFRWWAHRFFFLICDSSSQIIQLLLIFSLDPKEKLLIYTHVLLDLLPALLLMLPPLRHALNHILILLQRLLLALPNLSLLKKGLLIGLQFLF